MKPMRIPPHAMQNLTDREIVLAEVELTLAAPEAVAVGHYGRDVYMRRYFDTILGQEMLLRIIVEETTTERVVVTAHKTSQIRRYLKGV